MRSARRASRTTGLWLVFVAVFFVCAAWIGWTIYGSRLVVSLLATGEPHVTAIDPVGKPDATAMATLGIAGDAFGGLNALFAAFTIVLVGYAGWLQRASLIEARSSLGFQEFKDLFFRLLQLSQDAADRVEDEIGKSRGIAAFESLCDRHFARFVYKPESNTDDLKLEELLNFYHFYAFLPLVNSLGPYFRLLFQTFELVATSDIPEGEAERFSKLARGQISEQAVFLLALNGLTSRGTRFKRHIEGMGLLEHIHPDLSEDFRALLLTRYAPTAFMGSKDRKLYFKKNDRSNWIERISRMLVRAGRK